MFMMKATNTLVIAAAAWGLSSALHAQTTAANPHEHHMDHATSMKAATDPFEGINPRFELLDREGKLVSDEDFRGQYVLLAFGFTHCEHICPLMAFNMGNALRAAEHDAVGIFISVDTERDTPGVTDDYASSFGETMMGLGGSLEQINSAAKSFNVSYAVTKTQDYYTVQHTANIYLIDPEGELAEVFPLTASAAEILEAMP
jgi:protein SCO1/2